MTTRLSLLLMIAILSIVTLVRTQPANTSKPTTVTGPYEASELLQQHRKISAVSIPDPRNLFRSSRSRDKSILWRVHLALQLVKRPELNERQVRIILDAISVSSPEFFAASNDTPSRKANDAFKSLTQRLLSAFPRNEAAELFTNIADGKTEADILKLYYDVSALSLKKRRASFRNASSNDKSDLWRTHLALFLVKRPELNEWQKQIILAAMSLATPEYFEIRSSDSAWKAKVREPSRSLEAQIVNAFSFEDGAKIFATLGDDADLAKSSASIFLKSINYKPLSDSGPYKQWAHIRFAGQEMELERSSCQCSTQSDWCHMSSSCSGSNCNPTQSGCGTLWSYPCNGASCQ